MSECVFVVVIPIENKLTDAVSIAPFKRSFGSSHSAPLWEVKARLAARRGAAWAAFPYIQTNFLPLPSFFLDRKKFLTVESCMVLRSWNSGCTGPLRTRLMHLTFADWPSDSSQFKHGSHVCSFFCNPVLPHTSHLIPCVK